MLERGDHGRNAGRKEWKEKMRNGRNRRRYAESVMI